MGLVHLGQAAQVYVDSFPGRPFAGSVTQIANEAEFTPKNVQTRGERANTVFAVKLALQDGGGALKAGMPADAYFCAAAVAACGAPASPAANNPVAASLDRPLSITDDDLAERIANAFKLHPWIAEVCQVRKYHPARIKVDLVYYRPVLMVQVPGGLLPVDISGVLLPSTDFSPLEAGRYPRLVGIDTVPVGPPGERWGDVRVVGAAAIAASFGTAWQRLGLERIVPAAMVSVGRQREETYDLFTTSGTRVVWGRAPTTDMPGEVPAEEKVARLVKYAAERGSLDATDGRPQELDVRGLQAVNSAPRTTNSKPRVIRR